MPIKSKHQLPTSIIRDISWLSFNERVLQEAQDSSNSLAERIKFLGIFSNNLDEFFRVRVAILRRMLHTKHKTSVQNIEQHPKEILTQIQKTVVYQQKEFEQTYQKIITELNKKKIFIRSHKQLNKTQKLFIENYFNENIRTHLVPLMIESIQHMPLLKDKSIYLACHMSISDATAHKKYALIEVPADVLGRFIILPTTVKQKHIILLEDVIEHCLPFLFGQFGYNVFDAQIIKVTRDAELDIDNDISKDAISHLQKELKKRKKGEATRFVYDRTIDKDFLHYLTHRLHLHKQDDLIAGGKIHNFKDFIHFPTQLIAEKKTKRKTFIHPLLVQPKRIMPVLDKQDVLLHFPYHSFESIIDLLRESSIDESVKSIKITAYRLAKNSRIVNALINAVRNEKKVTVVIELRARFDEEANLAWKTKLEEEGIEVLIGKPLQKVHAKICLITKQENNKIKEYGFVSTGNINEQTAKIYGDHCLLTSNKKIVNNIKNIFANLQNSSNLVLKNNKMVIASPFNTRNYFLQLIDNEIANAKQHKKAKIILKLNSLSDDEMINKLHAANAAGVQIHLIIRGICCAFSTFTKTKNTIAIRSIVDEYLEHARVMYFENAGKSLMFISSADWMKRNLHHRIEATVQITDKALKKELLHILHLQLSENIKARIIDNEQNNNYVMKKAGEKNVRSQVEIYNYLVKQNYNCL